MLQTTQQGCKGVSANYKIYWTKFPEFRVLEQKQ
jgi:hypothetical protein